MVDDIDDLQRRSFLKWASAVGLTSVAPGTVAAVAQDNGEGPPDEMPVEPPDAARDGDVQITHPAEYGQVRERVTRAASEDDPSEKLATELRRQLDDGERDAYDLHVRTVGTPTTVETSRRGRQIDGWSPKQGEVQRLSQFGEVRHVPEFLSTKVTLGGVDADDVSVVADLPFVLTVGVVPEIAEDPAETVTGDDPPLNHTDGDWNLVPPSNARDDYCGFPAVAEEDAIDEDTSVKFAVIDHGYGTSDGIAPYVWKENHAESLLDEDLADAFAEWSQDDYYDWHPSDSHGTEVANTLAYMLPGEASEMFVPINPLIYTDEEYRISETRSAIEFCTYHDIDVANVSLGFAGEDVEHCQSMFCDELAGYVAAGHIPVLAVGNNEENDDDELVLFEAQEPGASRFTISVGGVHGDECSGGYELAPGSSLSDPARYHDETDCEPCHDTGVHEQFVPDVHGVFAMIGDNLAEDGETYDLAEHVTGTSYAAPQFAAAAILLKEHGLDDFWAAKEAAREEAERNVCPDEEAKAGQLFDANHLLGHAPPTPPRDPRVEWASDTAVELSWDPAHSPGEPDIYIYFVTHSAGGNGQSWYVYAPETSIVIDGLVDGQSYDVTFSAGDDWGNQSEHPGPEVTFSTLASEELVASINPEKTELSAGETARFDWTDETDDGNWVPEAPHWDFDDGATETDWYAEHTYDEPGTYWVTMEATNDEGRTTTAFVEITVS